MKYQELFEENNSSLSTKRPVREDSFFVKKTIELLEQSPDGLHMADICQNFKKFERKAVIKAIEVRTKIFEQQADGKWILKSRQTNTQSSDTLVKIIYDLLKKKPHGSTIKALCKEIPGQNEYYIRKALNSSPSIFVRYQSYWGIKNFVVFQNAIPCGGFLGKERIDRIESILATIPADKTFSINVRKIPEDDIIIIDNRLNELNSNSTIFPSYSNFLQSSFIRWLLFEDELFEQVVDKATQIFPYLEPNCLRGEDWIKILLSKGEKWHSIRANIKEVSIKQSFKGLTLKHMPIEEYKQIIGAFYLNPLEFNKIKEPLLLILKKEFELEIKRKEKELELEIKRKEASVKVSMGSTGYGNNKDVLHEIHSQNNMRCTGNCSTCKRENCPEDYR